MDPAPLPPPCSKSSRHGHGHGTVTVTARSRPANRARAHTHTQSQRSKIYQPGGAGGDGPIFSADAPTLAHVPLRDKGAYVPADGCPCRLHRQVRSTGPGQSAALPPPRPPFNISSWECRRFGTAIARCALARRVWCSLLAHKGRMCGPPSAIWPGTAHKKGALCCVETFASVRGYLKISAGPAGVGLVRNGCVPLLLARVAAHFRACTREFRPAQGWAYYLNRRQLDTNVEASSSKSYFGLNPLSFAARRASPTGPA